MVTSMETAQAAKADPPRSSAPAALPTPLEWWTGNMTRAWQDWLQLLSLGGVTRAGEPAGVTPVVTEHAQVDPPTSADRLLHATMGRLSVGISPPALALACADWAFHLAVSPGKQQLLLAKAVRKAVLFGNYAALCAAGSTPSRCIEPLPQDRRFAGERWQQWPFNLVYQGFLLHQQWWHNATTGIGGVSPHHEQVVSFMARQLLDMVSPGTSVLTNPEVLQTTLQEGGHNLLRGSANLLADWERALGGKPPVGAEAFLPGREVALTPGKVVYRNPLIELIQYAPQTPQAHAEPILIVPAWIMKYYILDLSPDNSLVNYLVQRGHTVFMISWHNPDAEDRELSMDDYLRHGVLDALAAVRAILPGRQVHAAGYCLGGTLLAIAAAWLARQDDAALASVTLLAAQTDFTEAGELMLFIDESQLNYLEDIMWDQGYLDTKQMAGAFQLLRSNDLVWSRVVHDYLMGRRAPMSDLMAWNADATRMPYRMHSEYLRRLFLNNDLFEGRYRVDGQPVALRDIEVPMFVVSTEYDHVAPWRSVYKVHLLSDVDITFVLASGGHNAGIVSEPGRDYRHYRLARRHGGERYVDPGTWVDMTPLSEGSWWPAWAGWLEALCPELTEPPPLGAPGHGYPVLGPAPGHYIHER